MTTLITGASGGLGEEFARIAAQDGKSLVLVARSTEKLQELAKELESTHAVNVTVLTMDLSGNDSVDQLVAELQTKKIVIGTLINNAGFGNFGYFAKSDWKKEESMIAVNVHALTALTRALLPDMIARKSGKILNVASTASFQPGPLMAVYYATKAYVLNLSLALSIEVEGTGVTVTCLCPGPTRTGFAEHAEMGGSKLFRRRTMDAHTVVKAGYDAMLKGKPLMIPGLLNKIGAFMTRFIPRMTAGRIAKAVQSPAT